MNEQTDGAQAPREEELRVLDSGALRALAHPLRVHLYDLIRQRGPQTASTLAELTGESSGATSYHLRALAKHNLIREVDGKGTARERWWESPDTGGVSFTNPAAMKTPAGRAATQVVMTEFLNRRHNQLLTFLSDQLRAGALDDDEPTLVSTGTARLTDEQAHELINRMQALIDEAVATHRDQTGEGVRPFTIRTDIFALPDERPRP